MENTVQIITVYSGWVGFAPFPHYCCRRTLSCGMYTKRITKTCKPPTMYNLWQRMHVETFGNGKAKCPSVGVCFSLTRTPYHFTPAPVSALNETFTRTTTSTFDVINLCKKLKRRVREIKIVFESKTTSQMCTSHKDGATKILFMIV